MFALILILSSLSALASAKKSMMHFDVGKEDAETGPVKVAIVETEELKRGGGPSLKSDDGDKDTKIFRIMSNFTADHVRKAEVIVLNKEHTIHRINAPYISDDGYETYEFVDSAGGNMVEAGYFTVKQGSPDVSARVYAGDFAYFIEPAPSDSEGGEGLPSSAHNMLKVDVSKGGDEKCEVEEEEKGEEGEKPNLGGSAASWQRWCVSPPCHDDGWIKESVPWHTWCTRPPCPYKQEGTRPRPKSAEKGDSAPGHNKEENPKVGGSAASWQRWCVSPPCNDDGWVLESAPWHTWCTRPPCPYKQEGTRPRPKAAEEKGEEESAPWHTWCVRPPCPYKRDGTRPRPSTEMVDGDVSKEAVKEKGIANWFKGAPWTIWCVRPPCPGWRNAFRARSVENPPCENPPCPEFKAEEEAVPPCLHAPCSVPHSVPKTVVTVMIYYDSYFQRSTRNIKQSINNLIATANMGFSNSGVPIKLKLHCYERYNKEMTGKSLSAFEAFISHKGRRREDLTKNADIAMWIGKQRFDDNVGGRAKQSNLLKPFGMASVFGRLYRFGHEVGHIFGCHHDGDTISKYREHLTYSYGKGNLIPKSNMFTIMAYPGGRNNYPINYYSGPGVVGPLRHRTGDKNKDNVRVLKARMSSVANIGSDSGGC